MHAELPCGLRSAGAGGPPGCHLCPQAGCRALRRGRPLASLTHLFLECPAYEAARAWLQDTWQAVAGQRPPLDAQVLLGDRAEAWPHYPQQPELQRLWSALRLAWLHATWATHLDADPSRRTAHAVVAATVSYLQQRIRAAFCTCDVARRVYDRLPLSVTSTTVRELGVAAFARQWGAGGGVLCDVFADPVSGWPRLHLRLDMAHPVAAPLPSPPAQQQQQQQQQQQATDQQATDEEAGAAGVGVGGGGSAV
jgi:hypothetical protein